MSNRTYSPEFKLQVVLEALQSDRTDAEIARRCREATQRQIRELYRHGRP